MITKNNQEYYTLPEAAELASLSVSHLRRLAISGKCVAYKDSGGRWLFLKEDLEKLNTIAKFSPKDDSRDAEDLDL